MPFLNGIYCFVWIYRFIQQFAGSSTEFVPFICAIIVYGIQFEIAIAICKIGQRALLLVANTKYQFSFASKEQYVYLIFAFNYELRKPNDFFISTECKVIPEIEWKTKEWKFCLKLQTMWFSLKQQ